MTQNITNFVKSILDEDIGRGDLFARIQSPKSAKAIVGAKSAGVFAGQIYAIELAKEARLELDFFVCDGDLIDRGAKLLEVRGDDIAILQAERSLLNLLQHASGIATQTRRYADRLKDCPIALLDTRKTRPLLRRFEKYAARIGGAVNHRFGLDDCLMIKDTHLATIGDLKAFIQKARKNIPWTATIEVECETIETAQAAFEAKADIAMCDNMDVETIKTVVALRDKLSPSTKIEASGDITLENIDRYKTTRIDAVSVGAIVHRAVWLNFSMKMLNG
ncbi:MAG: carboxylating nicotinate-nucleotide diphosphorylase [Helicobacteraceae bacterium]|jgi:nicotinate-nucleotide pyrophosphorylase (carboxylating)|nr:carboxylating nicotinate-nucleotide diphosphorylase [Helicobacteraceae bacterium]